MQIISITNQKGGVGKSSTALALGAGFLSKGLKVLFIDLDAQGNLSYTLGADATGQTRRSSFDVLMQNTTAKNAIQQAGQSHVIGSSPSLSGADMVLTAVGKEYRLKEALETLKGMYDYIIIDTPPALGILTVNALTASTGVLIPAQADIYSLQGVSQLYSTIQTVKKYCNPSLQVMGIALTRYNRRAIISRDIAEMMGETAGQLETKLFKSKIREATAVKEAQARRQDIFTYAPKSNAAKDYLGLVEEILKGE
jgi:chromosome partitioning protein